MPQLHEYFSVGFCSGYGDGDYRVSVKVADLSREELNELKLAALSAIRCADDMWRRAQTAEIPAQELALQRKETKDDD